MARRGFTFFFLLICGAGLYALGYWHGGGAALSTATLRPPSSNPPNEVVDAELSGLSGTPGLAADKVFAQHLADGAWYQLERWLGENQARLTEVHGEALVRTLSAKINKYDAVTMRQVLRVYLEQQPGDVAVLFLLSDLQQIGGMREAALETLFQLLDYPVDVDVAERAQQGAGQIIRVIDNELKSRGALAEREAFWRHVSQRMPASDYYRFQWAQVLAELKQFDAAKRVLAETGTSDIDQGSIDELVARIDNAADGLQFERDGDRLLSAALAPTGRSLTLLVDTGATVTSLSKRALRIIGAEALPDQVRVRTANGVAVTGVYRVAELEVQGRRFTDLRVIELPVELPGLDGLLGLDLINQLGLEPL